MGWQILGMVAVVAAIGISIALHEFGHFIPAKRFNLRIPDYAIGFGPALFSRRFGETKFAWRLIPVGGYVRMIGMYPPANGPVRTGRFAALAEEARAESMSEVLPSDAGRTYYELPVWKRIVIMLGGPTMNLLLAALIFTIAFAGIGFPSASTTVDSVAPCWFSATNPEGAAAADGSCVGGQSAAAQAGLKPGDEVIKINGQNVSDPTSMHDALGTLPASGRAELVVRDADGRERAATVTFQSLNLRDWYQDSTIDPNERVSVVGVFTKPGRERVSIALVPKAMWNITSMSVRALVMFPKKIWELGNTLIHDGTRDPNGPVSVVGVTVVGGQIASSEATVLDKALSLLMLAGSLNLFLFLFNLLPLLPLDGGHVVGALWELVRNRIRRLRGLAPAGPVDTARLLPLTYAMSVVLISVGSLVIFADIVKPISLGG